MDVRMLRRIALVVPATLVVVMVAASAVGVSAPRTVQNTNNFDLVWSQTDMNGIPFRPKWRWQSFHSGAPDPQQCQPVGLFGLTALTCTSQAVKSDNAATCLLPDSIPGGGQKLNGMSGHRNWGAAATYDGELFWGSHTSSLMDDDYNFRLVYLNHDLSGLTKPNVDPTTGIGHSALEFDSDETVDHWGKNINDQTYFWDRFHAAVDQSDSAARSLVDGRYAIVTGVLGLDVSHGGSSELHPVLAMAVRINYGPGFEDWAMFVRSSGDEGWCSSNQWPLPLPKNNRFTFALPWQGSIHATALDNVTPTAHFLTNDTTGQAEGPDLTYVQGEKVLVSFTVPKAASPLLTNYRPAIWGVLHLVWKRGGVRVPPSIKSPFAGEEATLEGTVSDALKKLPQATVLRMTEQLALAKPDKARVIKSARKPVVVSSLKAVPVPAKPPAVVSIADPVKVKLDAQRVRLVCAAFRGTIPGVDICR